jgi:hypothetical protein
MLCKFCVVHFGFPLIGVLAGNIVNELDFQITGEVFFDPFLLISYFFVLKLGSTLQILKPVYS